VEVRSNIITKNPGDLHIARGSSPTKISSLVFFQYGSTQWYSITVCKRKWELNAI
jgi:hypothetical protein